MVAAKMELPMTDKLFKALYIVTAALALTIAFAAAWLFGPNLYHTAMYRVDVNQVIPPVSLWAFAIPAIAAVAAFYLALSRWGSGAPRLAAIALSPLFLNAFTLIRSGLHAKPFFFEPLLLTVPAAAAVALAISLSKPRGEAQATPTQADRSQSRVPALAIVAVAIVAAYYMYEVQAHFLARLAFGWTDVGLNYMRVRNTALVHGFLQETPGLPPFYDHFNAGLAVLVPFWWLFPTLKLVMWAQALFLAGLGPAVYVYARGRGIGAWMAVAIAAAALLHPSVAQIAYSFSYGFHPTTLALPAVVLSIHFWEKRRWWPFVFCAVFAGSMEETLFPLYAGIGLVTLIAPRGKRIAGLVLTVASIAAFLIVTQAVLPAVVGEAKYFQMVKFAHLGSSVTAILLSPFTKPAVFWGLIFSAKSVVFVALLLAGMGFLPLLAPRQLLYPLVVLVFVLLLNNPDVKSISFWYQSLILVTWFTAAAAGAQRLGGWWSGRRAAGAAVAGMLVAALAASHFYGLLPWSRMTMPFQVPRSPQFLQDASGLARFADAVPPNARVLSAMRTATLFVNVGTLNLIQGWHGETDYDLVVVQKMHAWGETPEQINAVIEQFAASGQFEPHVSEAFVVFVRR